MHLELATLIVDDYDEAVDFFVDVLGFDLVEDTPSLTNDGRPKRWVVVRPPRSTTGLLLARADGEAQAAAVGAQHAGRVGLFLRVDDFDVSYQRMRHAGVEFLGDPRHEPYGSVVVFKDMAGNKWDLLGPRPEAADAAHELIVRRERAGDHDDVRAVHRAAFATRDNIEPVEAPLVDALRNDGWISELSWVAEVAGHIVGHNLASRATVGNTACVGLGPIGVVPTHQRGGIGSALMRAMIGAADALGQPLIGLLGDPAYYARFGFRPSTDMRIDAPDPAWGSFFQVLPLSTWDDSISGQFSYALPFDELGT